MMNRFTERLLHNKIVVITAAVCAIGVGAILWIGYVVTPPDHEAPSVAHATWVLASLTFVLAVGVPLTIWDSSKKALAQEQDQFYAQLDDMYLQIQKLIIQHPHLGEPKKLLQEAHPPHLIQYDAFAFAVWNFIESIDDFIRDDRESSLATTWQCVIDHEGKNHTPWLERPQNQIKFKPEFVEKMARKFHFHAEARPPTSIPQQPSVRG
jgi:hypothetical protein